MTAARKPQDPAKFARYRQRMKARGLKEVRRWVYDPDAPGFQEALDRALDRINASADRDAIDRFDDAMQDKSPFDKFISLHAGEELLRAKSLALIATDEDMRLHAAIIEQAQDLLDILIHDEAHKDDDDLTIKLLGVRLFNGCAVTLSLLLSGYYQNAAFQMRDLLETSFLLDYLQSNRALIAEWRTSNKRTRMRKFGPATVRIALDDRDGFTERKREEHYDLLCELASHPTYRGFQMLCPDGSNAHYGPFLEAKAMNASLSELAKIVVHAVGIFTLFIKWKSSSVAEAKIGYIEAQGRWLTRFFNAPSNATLVARLRADLETMRAAETAKAPAAG